MTSMLSPLRSIGATLIIAGVASFGAVAVAPAASAAPVQSASTGAGAVAEKILADAVERRERAIDRLLGQAAPAPAPPAPATAVDGDPKPCTMSLRADALENIGCALDRTAPRF